MTKREVLQRKIALSLDGPTFLDEPTASYWRKNTKSRQYGTTQHRGGIEWQHE